MNRGHGAMIVGCPHVGMEGWVEQMLKESVGRFFLVSLY